MRHVNQNMTNISKYPLGVLSITSTICGNACAPAEIRLQELSEISAQTHVFHLCIHWILLQILLQLLLLLHHFIFNYKPFWFAGFNTIPNSQSCTEKYFCSEGPRTRIQASRSSEALCEGEKLHQMSLLTADPARVMSCHKMSLHMTKGHLI